MIATTLLAYLVLPRPKAPRVAVYVELRGVEHRIV